MIETSGSIKYKNEELNANIEEKFITYSEERRQEEIINKENAKLIFSPKFIPLYPELLEYLTPIEALLFGFIDFYKHNSSSRFYFKNEDLAKILHCCIDTISHSISTLEKKGFIKTSRKIKAGGGQIRFITDIIRKIHNPDYGKPSSQSTENAQTNKNKINKNKIKKISPSSPNYSAKASLPTANQPLFSNGSEASQLETPKIKLEEIQEIIKYYETLYLERLKSKAFLPSFQILVPNFKRLLNVYSKEQLMKMIDEYIGFNDDFYKKMSFGLMWFFKNETINRMASEIARQNI